MPNTALEDAITEAFALAPSNVVYLNTLEISHPSLPGSVVYLVRDRANHDLTLEDASTKTFKACPFRFTLPPVTDEGIQELNLAIDNVDRQITDFLKQAKNYTTPTTVTYRPYLSTDPTTPQMNPPLVLWLKNVRVRTSEVTGTATFADLVNKRFPTEFFTRDRFPSLANTA